MKWNLSSLAALFVLTACTTTKAGLQPIDVRAVPTMAAIGSAVHSVPRIDQVAGHRGCYPRGYYGPPRHYGYQPHYGGHWGRGYGGNVHGGNFYGGYGRHYRGPVYGPGFGLYIGF